MIYANAKDVLPPELLKEVKKYHTGLLFISSTRAQDRRNRVLNLINGNPSITTKEIASIIGITTRRVNQIRRGK